MPPFLKAGTSLHCKSPKLFELPRCVRWPSYEQELVPHAMIPWHLNADLEALGALYVQVCASKDQQDGDAIA